MTVGQRFNPYRKFTGYFVPECVLNYPGISMGAKLCLAVLYRMIGKHEDAWPKQDVIAKKMGCTVRSVISYISELEADGFIQSEQRGLGKTNTYAALWHHVYEESGSENFADQEVNGPSVLDVKDSSEPSIELKREIKEERNIKNPLTLSDFLLQSRRLPGKHYSGKDAKRIEEFWRDEWCEMAFEAVVPLVDRELGKQQRQKHEHPSAPRSTFSRPRFPSKVPVVVGDCPIFENYIAIFQLAGVPIGDVEREDAWPLWEPLTEEQRQASGRDAVRVCQAQVMPWIPTPKNHLLKKPWTRKVVERVLPSPKLTGGEKMAEVMAEVRRRRLAKEAGLSEY